ncbi:unannotated protein [freshwater metagenome]|uniref:Unannotated protein n=1 Tax=freshwater metagenome TaxID=449393 RepID=A0A6J7DAD9_9ZZZZ
MSNDIAERIIRYVFRCREQGKFTVRRDVSSSFVLAMSVVDPVDPESHKAIGQRVNLSKKISRGETPLSERVGRGVRRRHDLRSLFHKVTE